MDSQDGFFLLLFLSGLLLSPPGVLESVLLLLFFDLLDLLDLFDPASEKASKSLRELLSAGRGLLRPLAVGGPS